MKGLMLTGGAPISCARITEFAVGADFIICADSGAENAHNCSITPDEIVGDFDSVNHEILNIFKQQGVPIKEYPGAKDLTDTQLAAEICAKKGCSEVIITGATGDRTDHMLSNIMLLLWFRQNNIRAQIINETERIFLCEKHMEVMAPAETVVSLVPLTEKVIGVTLHGMQYPLNKAVLDMGRPISISNVLLGEKGSIDFESGEMLVVMQH